MNHKMGGARVRALALTLACVALALVAALAAPGRVLAAAARSPAVRQVSTTGGAVPAAREEPSFSYELVAVDGAPLPPDASGGAYEFTIAGSATESIGLAARRAASAGTISFESVGNYEYDLRCATQAVDGLTLDARKYHVTVVVVNDDSGDGIHVSKLVVKDASGRKPDAVEFDPSYKGKPEPAKTTPSKGEAKQPTVFGQKLAKTGDASWGLAVFSGVLGAAGVAFVVVSLALKRRNA